MDSKNKEMLLEILKDFNDFASMRKIDYFPIYLLGGSGAIIGEYIERATLDIDFLDMNYNSSIGRLFKMFGKSDMLDLYLTTIPLDFITRAKKIEGFKSIFVLSREDIILSKIGRYSEKDIEDITKMIGKADIDLILNLILVVQNRNDISEIILKEFNKNIEKFKDDFDV